MGGNAVAARAATEIIVRAPCVYTDVLRDVWYTPASWCRNHIITAIATGICTPQRYTALDEGMYALF